MPTFVLLTFHWKIGEVPPLVGVAVNVTFVPVQTGFCDGTTETLTGRFGLTIMTIVSDVAGLFVIQVVLDEVRTQETWSPLTGV